MNLSLRVSKNWFRAPVFFFFFFFVILTFPGDTSVVVLFVLCFGVEFSCCLNLMYVFIVLVKFGSLFGTYWEKAAHSA